VSERAKLALMVGLMDWDWGPAPSDETLARLAAYWKENEHLPMRPGPKFVASVQDYPAIKDLRHQRTYNIDQAAEAERQRLAPIETRQARRHRERLAQKARQP
jgi:hypothetical protein